MRGANDPRPPIEILSETPATESVRVVTSGRPLRRGRVWALAASAVVVGLVVGGIALSDDDPTSGDRAAPAVDSSTTEADGTATTRDRSSATASSTTTVPVGPVFGRRVGAGLLVAGSSGFEMIDLDTGRRNPLEDDLPFFGGQAPGVDSKQYIKGVHGGVVLIVVGSPTRAAYYRLSPTGEMADPVDLGPADQIMDAGRSDQVWLVDHGGGTRPPGYAGPVEARLVDLEGHVLRSFEVASEPVSASLEEGFIVERGGRIYLADENGLREVGVGHVLGVSDSELIVMGCDSEGECSLARQPIDGSPPKALRDMAGLDPNGSAFLNDEGPIALMSFGGFFPGDGFDPGLVVLSEDGETLGTFGAWFSDAPTWLPGDLGFLTVMEDRVAWLRPQGDEWNVAPAPAALKSLDKVIMFLIER